MPPTTLRSDPDVLPAPAQAPTETLDALPRLTPRGLRNAAPASLRQPGRYLVVEAETEARRLPLAQGMTRIGRSWNADVCLDDPAVSRRHAILVNDPAGARILDDRSANGTYVNGRRVTEAALAHGDEIVLGRLTLVYIEIG